MRTITAVVITVTIAALANTSLMNPVQATPDDKSANHQRPTVDEARQQARILHSAMHATLKRVHDDYYKEDKSLPIPAASLKEVFAEVEKEQQLQLRWLAVEGDAMNVDHQAKTPFENEAVKALSSGKKEFEQVENGIYQHAGAIKLTNVCLKCHVPNRKSLEDRTAGLIIKIPVR